MLISNRLSKDDIRSEFSIAMSEMYQREVPQYGTLLEIVADINQRKTSDLDLDVQHRMEVERHGAIRLGTARELAMMRRLLAVMGMEPVGYYDLTVAGLPVHATCFRPLNRESLLHNPFRVFTSVLRLELINDHGLRAKAKKILETRQIFTPRCISLIEKFEVDQFFSSETAKEFISEALETFRWHKTATADIETYKAMQATHPLVADIVCFKGPHINHLTPRVFDIEAAQIEMSRCGLQAKATIEGPPLRRCPILLRQTSFLALEEEVSFSEGAELGGKHKARFGEIEQRGMALTRKGRCLYDRLISQAREKSSNTLTKDSEQQISIKVFEDFPDDLSTIRQQGLAYFTYKASGIPVPARFKTRDDTSSTTSKSAKIDTLVDSGALIFEPITYEDFLPISAAGIFKSNIGANMVKSPIVSSDKSSFENDLGCPVGDEFEVYSAMERASIDECLAKLSFSQKE